MIIYYYSIVLNIFNYKYFKYINNTNYKYNYKYL